jgi:hypothetical protein
MRSIPRSAKAAGMVPLRARTVQSRYRMRLHLWSLVLLTGCSCSGSPASNRPDAFVPFNGDGGQVFLGPGVPADAPMRFASSPRQDAARQVEVLYPLDGVLLPRNVFSPDIQWQERGAMGDLYRVTLTSRAGMLTGYTAHNGVSFRYDYLFDNRTWRSFADQTAGSSLELRVDRWESASGEVIAGPPIRVRVARGGIAGAVYYWALGEFHETEGRILRVRQGTDVAPSIENFMPQPPAGNDGTRCAACHGLARDGNRIAVSLHDGSFGGVFDLTDDLSGPTPPMEFRFAQSWFFAAFNPDGSRLFMTDAAQGAFLLDGHTGAPVTPTGAELGNATHPAWSPDGVQLALIGGADDAWDPTAGNLAVVSYQGGDVIGARNRIHTGADLASAPEGGSLDAYPSYSPDSRFIAFQHGTRTLASAADASAALYVISREGGPVARLDHASEGGAFYPNYTPFTTPADDQAEVQWVMFYTQRDYGNSIAGTRGSRRRQIWVTAVSTDPLSGGDPSNVPYWLPGQDTRQENASAYWAPVPCRPTGEGCSTSAQCCSDVCGEFSTCEAPRVCRHEGETCSVRSDCCSGLGLSCIAGVCVIDAPI